MNKDLPEISSFTIVPVPYNGKRRFAVATIVSIGHEVVEVTLSDPYLPFEAKRKFLALIATNLLKKIFEGKINA